MSAAMGDNEASAQYEYPQSQMVMTYLGIPGLSLFCFGVGVFAISEHSYVFGVLCILVAAWFISLSVFGSLMCSSIIVSDRGIASRNFGRVLKFIGWEDVTKVKKVRRWNAGSRSYEDVFYAYDGDFPGLRERMVNLRGPIVFTDRITGLRALLDNVNEYAQRHRFPLIVLDQEVARERTSQKGAGAWERTVSKVDEIKVAAL
jgi:hypothetical protein